MLDKIYHGIAQVLKIFTTINVLLYIMNLNAYPTGGNSGAVGSWFVLFANQSVNC